MATKQQGKPRERRVFHAGRLVKGRPMCPKDGSYHFGPITPRPDIRQWLRNGFAALDGDDAADVPEQFDCARCNSTTSFRPHRQVAA